MSDALRYEWTRIRTVRSTYWLIGLALIISMAIAFIIALVFRNDPATPELTARVLYGGGSDIPTLIPIFMAIIGVLAVGHEYRYGTIQPTLTALPQRSRLLLAKVIVVVAVSVVFGLLRSWPRPIARWLRSAKPTACSLPRPSATRYHSRARRWWRTCGGLPVRIVHRS
jgi:hypothetical protein